MPWTFIFNLWGLEEKEKNEKANKIFGINGLFCCAYMLWKL